MNSADKKVILEAQKIIEQSNPQIHKHAQIISTQKKHHLEDLTITNALIKSQKMVDFIGTVQLLGMLHMPSKKIKPLIFLRDVSVNVIKLHENILVPYNTHFLKLRSVKPNDIISFSGKINSYMTNTHDNTQIPFVNHINHARYINAPSDLSLRHVVPKDKNARTGYVLTQIYPPLTKPNGTLNLNYPSIMNFYIKAYLHWLNKNN